MEAPLLVGDIAVIVVAAAALLMAYASSFLFRGLLARLWQWVPVFGQGALAWADGVIAGLSSSLASWIESAVGPLTSVIAGPWQKVDHLLTQIEATFGAMQQGMAGIAAAVQAQVAHTLIAPLQGQLADLRSWAQGQVASLTSQIEWVHKAVDQDIHAWLGQAVASLQQLIGGVQQQAQQAQQTAYGAAQHAQQLAGQVGDLSPGVVGAMIATALDALDTALHTGLSGVQGSVGGLAADLSAVQAQAQATEQEVSTYLKECGQPLCDALQSPLSDLQGIAGLADAGLILALLAGAVNDPKGTATLVQSTVGAGMKTLAGLFGVGGS